MLHHNKGESKNIEDEKTKDTVNMNFDIGGMKGI